MATKTKNARKQKRRAATKQLNGIRELLTPAEAKLLRKARRRTPDSTSRIGIKYWVINNDVKNKDAMIKAGYIPAPPTPKAEPAAEE
jgi:hypothetical protein